MGKEDEVVNELLERMKEPGLAMDTFLELARKVRIIRGLTEQ